MAAKAAYMKRNENEMARKAHQRRREAARAAKLA